MPRFPGGPPLMPLMMPPLNPVLGNPLMPPTNLRPTSPIISPFSNLPNPFLQNLPQAKDEPDNGAFPTVMIPGIGPCMMIPTVMNEGNMNGSVRPFLYFEQNPIFDLFGKTVLRPNLPPLYFN